MREARTRATAARTLRVLLVEDSENDAMLLLRELRRGGYEPLLERVHTQEGMEEAWRAAEAAGESFQIVISDYFMPRFGASAALKLLRKLDPDVPFIVVSGKVGEEAAVEIMKAGADDYLTKENMSRLCPAIERELREVEVKRERELALSRSEERWGRLVEQAADAIFVHDLEGRFVDVNRQACESLGYTREELLSMSVADVEAGYEQGSLQKLWRQIASGQPRTLEGVHRRKDGSTFPVEIRVGVFQAEERPLMLALVRDISGRREAEERIRETEARYRTLVEQIPAVTYIQEPIESDNPKAITYMSPQYEAMLGYAASAEIVDEEHWLRMLHPDDRERVLAEELKTDETGEPYRVEYRLIARDGRVVWVRDEAELVRDGEDEPLYWLGVQYDITEQKRTEEALGQSEAIHRTVVEQAAENIFLVDARTRRVLEANDALLRSLGYAEDELEGMTLYDIVAHDRESVDLNIGRVMEEGRASLGERQYRRKDGSLADVEVNVSAVPYNGEWAMCIVAHDVTQRKRAEAMLEEIREAERNRIARELHDATLQDIVYALQGVQVMQVMAGEDGDSALADMAEALRRSVEGLRGAIFELRLEGTLDRSLVDSLESLIDLNRRMARESYDIELVVAEDFPSRLPEKTGQELTRLVQEALTNVRRHAGAGHVRVELGTGGDLAFVEVSDDGRGFDPQSAKTGIGRKSMNQRALELGGELAVESTPGEGTRIRFSIPISRL